MVRSLTKQNQTGKPYVRPAKIESVLEVLVVQTPEEIRQRLEISDPNSPKFIPEECLVHLLREAMRQDNTELKNAIPLVLLNRCDHILSGKGGTLANEEFREEALGQFVELLVTDGQGDNPDKLDFFECRFNLAFRAFYLDLFKSKKVKSDKVRRMRTVSAQALVNDEEGYGDEEEALARVSESLCVAPEQEDTIDLSTLLERLTEEEREAYVLCCLMGYPEESDDPEVITAATRCNVTGRTIRNRLSKAKAKLAKVKEEL